MSSMHHLESLEGPIAAVQRLIERLNNQGVIIGGVAASVLGRPRLTADADAMLLLSLDELGSLLKLAKEEGLTPRLPDAEVFARRSRVVLLRHEDTGIDVDISLGLLPFEVETVERSQEIDVGTLRIRLPMPEDLIILKAVAHRPKDLEDIEAVMSVQQHLDYERVEFWVRQFAEVLEMPELWGDLEKIINRQDKTGHQ